MTTTQTSLSTGRAARPDSASASVGYTLDPSHSHVGFSVRHMMIANVRGEFTKVAGELSYDPAHPETTRIDVVVDASSVNTREEKRDAHLRSADFFDVEQYPNITFASKRVRADGDGLSVTGDLTIHGTTREVTLAVDEITSEFADPFGGRRRGATARTKIRRSDFGMKWNAALEAGGVLVGDEINIQIEVELVRK